jgi:PAS domain S-box-containing protein
MNRALRAERIAVVLAVYAVAGGLLTLLGWAIGVRRLAAWDNSAVTQMPNSALAIAAAGAGLLCFWRGRRRAAAVLGGVTAFIGLATVFEHLTGIDLAIDRLLVNRPWGLAGVTSPGRMGIPGSVSLSLIGLAIVARGSRRAERVAVAAGLLTVAVSTLSLIGYLFGADPLFTIPKLTTIALQTATMILALGLAIVLGATDRPPVSVLLGDAGASMLLRRTLPGLTLLLAALGWLSLHGHSIGLYDAAFAIAVLVFALITVQAAVLWSAASAVAAYETDMRTSRDRLAAILGSITDSFVTLDSDWRFVFINDESAVRLGKPRPELIGRRVWEVVPLSPDSEAYRQLHRAMNERVPVAYEVHHPPEGWFTVRAYPTGDGGLAVYSRDITDRKETERALRESEQKFALLFQKAAFGAALAKLPEGIIIDVNDEFTRMLGYSREEMLGKSALELGIGTDADALHDRELALSTKAGEKRIFLGNTTTIELGGENHMLTTLQDITVRKAAEEALRASAEALRTADRMKDEFLATLSHELRTPLTAIIGWSQILLNGKLDAKEQNIGLEAIRSSAKAQAQLTDDVLDVSRITTGKMRLERQWADLAAVIDGAVATVRPAAEGKRIPLELTLDRALPPHFVDPERLQQVVWNLLSNAIKFSSPGASVAVALRGGPDGTVVEVTDHGSGIARDFLPHVFERFRQADSSSTRTHAGLGLGLALSKDLVELHGGKIEVESEEGRGSRFTVRLPPPSLDAVTAAAVVPDAAASLSGLRVLYVDDREDARTLIAKMLQQHGADVLAASSADEALLLLAEARPDVVVTDLAMPVRDGYGLLEAIRADARWHRLPVLALTAQGRIDDESRAASAGFKAFLRKPIESHDLAEAVAKAARG